MTGLSAPTFKHTPNINHVTNMITTKRDLTILRNARDVTLTYTAIMEGQMVTPVRVGCQNDRKAGTYIWSDHTY